jgi:protein O-GlcNAc transferase
MGDVSQWLERARAQLAAEKLEEASATLQHALQASPANVPALRLLAQLAGKRGANAEALRLLERAVEIEPRNAAAHNDLALALDRAGHSKAAAAPMLRAAELDPQSAEIHNNLSVLLRELGRVTEATSRGRRAVELAPAQPVPHLSLAEALMTRGDATGAIDELRRAATLAPDMAVAWARLGAVLVEQELADQALAPLRRAAALDPDDAASRLLLGDALQATGARAEAIAAYRHALSIDPELPRARFGMGHAECDLQRYAEATDSLEQFLTRAPDQLPARYDLGRALFGLGRIEAARPHLQAAAGDTSPVRDLALRTLAVVIPGDPGVDNQQILEARRTWGRMLTRGIRPKRKRRRRPEGERLRIGYVSSFFHRRNWMKPVWGVLNRHDRARFEIHLFSDAPMDQLDEGYRRHHQDRFHDASELSNQDLARAIERCGIDVLVDLNGYSQQQRLAVYAARPAPVAIAWFNMYATSGLDCIDHLVGDAHVIPPQEEHFYTEQIVRVPGTYLAFEVSYPVPEVAPPPCTAGQPFTFGSLASQYKLTDEVVASWAEMLRGAPESRLLLRNAALEHATTAEHLAARFAAHGIERERLLLEGPAEHRVFLETYARIDLALDPFPYNGGTTTTEAVWQGVPVLTFRGDRWVSRTSASLLCAAGLEAFVAADREHHVQQAIALARDPTTPTHLQMMRNNMREQLRASPACDTAALAAALEQIYADVSTSGA